MRPSGRAPDALRSVRLDVNVSKYAEGSCLAVFGDTRDGMDVMREEIRRINAAGVDLVLYTGDLVGEGTEAEYKEGVRALATLNAPVLPAPGNHERKHIELYTRFFQRPMDYAVDHGGWRFISVDNSLGALTDAQIAWLNHELDARKPSVVFAHEPPVMGQWQHGFTGNAQAFNDTVARHANTKACVFAHAHLYDHQVYHGVPYVISGGGGAPLDLKLPLVAPDGMHGYNFLLCEAKGDAFSYTLVPVTGFPLRENTPEKEEDEDE